MSYRDDEPTVHAIKYLLGGGKVITCCGRIVSEEDATTDCVDVTCDSAGCSLSAETAFENRQEVVNLTW